MSTVWNTFEELTNAAGEALRHKLLRSKSTVRWYHILWRQVKKYMEQQQIIHFTSDVGRQYLFSRFGEMDYTSLQKRDKDVVKVVSVLCEFYDTGTLYGNKQVGVFEGPIGSLMKQYSAHLVSLRLKPHSVGEYELYLFRFQRFLHEHSITDVRAINPSHILNHIKEADPRFSSVVHITLRAIKGFLRYLYEQHLLETDLSSLIPKDNYKKQPKLPSTYSPDEIEQMIAGIDRGNANGKRNYAIVLLAARLGLRASDIANLCFENLHWDKSTIAFNQFKTGKALQLPILTDIGEAIIDYLKYGRPQSTETHVFLLTRSPFTRIYGGSVSTMVHTYLLRTGISIKGRKHGAHVLRHSLAGILLEKGTVMPVISEVLGHESTASTRYYLRIDLKSMRQCMLDVPPVAAGFYDQRGGYFYA